jgi:hypothetical protein
MSAPNAARNTAGCFMRTASPNTSPTSADERNAARSLHREYSHRHRATKRFTKCVAWAAIPSMVPLTDSHAYMLAATRPTTGEKSLRKAKNRRTTVPSETKANSVWTPVGEFPNSAIPTAYMA